jgi:hypothetical protein
MNMNDIRWLDGKNATGKFILEMGFANGSKSYLKNESYDKILHYYNILWDCPECVSMTIFNPQTEQIASKFKYSEAA